MRTKAAVAVGGSYSTHKKVEISREFWYASFAIAGPAFILFLARALFFFNPPPRRFLFEPRSWDSSTRIEASKALF